MGIQQTSIESRIISRRMWLWQGTLSLMRVSLHLSMQIITSEPACLMRYQRSPPVQRYRLHLQHAQRSSATVTTMTTAAVEADANEPMEEEYIPSSPQERTPAILLKDQEKGKGQQAPPDTIKSIGANQQQRRQQGSPGVAHVSEPQSFTEAVNHPQHSKQWEQAILDEYNYLDQE